jgi:choline-glycine betaine transporter
MKNSLYRDTRFLFLHFLVVASFVLFVVTMSDSGLYDIATDGFYHSQKGPWYSQPWIWSSILAGLVIVFLLMTQGWSADMLDQDSEEGTSHE